MMPAIFVISPEIAAHYAIASHYFAITSIFISPPATLLRLRRRHAITPFTPPRYYSPLITF